MGDSGSGPLAGLVVLEPVGGGEGPSGSIQPDGSLTIYNAKPGRYRVAVKTSMFAAMTNAANAARGGSQPVTMREIQGTFRAVPQAVENPQTSGIEVEVAAGKPLEIVVPES